MSKYKAAALPTLTETEIKAQCLEWLNLQWGVKVWKRNVGAMSGSHKGKRWFVKFAEPGMSDIEGVACGRHVEIEIKRPGREPTVEQDAWLQEMHQLGAIAFWCDSLDVCIEKFEAAAGDAFRVFSKPTHGSTE